MTLKLTPRELQAVQRAILNALDDCTDDTREAAALGNAAGKLQQQAQPTTRKCKRCTTAPWTCRTCGVRCCEHKCTNKANNGSATCSECWRRQ